MRAHFALQGLENHSTVDPIGNRENMYETVLAMKELASRGMAAEVVEEVNGIDPEFFVQNPVLLFQLKQVMFWCWFLCDMKFYLDATVW